MRYDLLIPLLIACALLCAWWLEMFSDSGFGQMARAMKKKGRYGKNITALVTPCFALGGIFVSVMKIFLDLGVPLRMAKISGVVGIVFFVTAFIGFLPFRLPGWMYPEYHVARRERVRVEKLARGEVVRMPSFGPAAVEAQRIEQALRAQERQAESGK